MRVLAIVLSAALGLAAAGATRAAEPLERAAVIQLDGTLTVATDGSVAELALATPVTEPLRQAIEARLRALRFVPVRVDGQPARARTGFSLDVAMFDRAGGGIRLAFDGISFHVPPGEAPVLPDGERPPMVSADMSPPRYPVDALRFGRTGRVELALRVGTDGRVEQATIVRSFTVGDRLDDRSARQTMHDFEAATLARAKTWRFTVPPGRSTGDAKERTCVSSVEFVAGIADLSPGRWNRVIRTAKHPVPWLGTDASEVSPPAGGLAMGTSAFRLASPLDTQPTM
jgi:TonB family protein